jgi:hypothetical protein
MLADAGCEQVLRDGQSGPASLSGRRIEQTDQRACTLPPLHDEIFRVCGAVGTNADKIVDRFLRMAYQHDFRCRHRPSLYRPLFTHCGTRHTTGTA